MLLSCLFLASCLSFTVSVDCAPVNTWCRDAVCNVAHLVALLMRHFLCDVNTHCFDAECASVHFSSGLCPTYRIFISKNRREPDGSSQALR